MLLVKRKPFKTLPSTEVDRASVEGKEKSIQKPNTSLILKNTVLQPKHSYSSVCKFSAFYNNAQMANRPGFFLADNE